jgi:hypothetical protein
MEETTTISPDYPPIPSEVTHPLTYGEFMELKAELDAITVRLPDNKMGLIWSNFNRIRGVAEPQPCGCASAAGHWKRALTELRAWVQSKI